jgi:membrane protease YdiL (CAAX protease family)
MEMVEPLKRYFGFFISGKSVRQPLPVWKAVTYGCGIVAAFFVGTILEFRLRFTGFGEALGAIPVLICAIFVLRLPPAVPIKARWGWRVLLLSLPFLFLLFADFGFPQFSVDQASIWIVVVAQALGVGVSEELTFRFGLHRLWLNYGAWFYVTASSTIFAVLHYPLGLQGSIISGVIGAAFATSRVAGMPLIPLILLHAFFDGPQFFRAMGMT